LLLLSFLLFSEDEDITIILMPLQKNLSIIIEK